MQQRILNRHPFTLYYIHNSFKFSSTKLHRFSQPTTQRLLALSYLVAFNRYENPKKVNAQSHLDARKCLHGPCYQQLWRRRCLGNLRRLCVAKASAVLLSDNDYWCVPPSHLKVDIQFRWFLFSLFCFTRLAIISTFLFV